MNKQNINVSRYSNPAAIGFQCSISPDDGQWCLFVDLAGKASLYVRTERAAEDGKVTQHYEFAAA